MAAITKSAPIQLDTAPCAVAPNGYPQGLDVLFIDPSGPSKITGLVAGEALANGDACYISSTGQVFRSTGAAANAAAKVDGFSLQDAGAGASVSLLSNCSLAYGSGLTPGTRYYLSGTVPGGLDTAPSAGGTQPIAMAVDARRVYVFQSRY